jgi:hypothetical protein
MAAVIIEGFENLGTSGNTPTVDGKFTVTGSNWRLGTGTYGGLCLENITSGVGCDLRWTHGQITNFVVGFHFKTANQNVGAGIWSAYDSTTRGLGLIITNSGSIQVVRNTTVLDTTLDSIIRAGIWHHIEFKGVINNTTGSYTLYVDGVSVLTGSGNTRGGTNNYLDNFRLLPGQGNSATLFSFDDFYLYDGTTAIGPQKVVCLHPTADSGSPNWTTSTGTDHYALVDENPNNGDTDYVETATSTNTDLFDVTDPDFTTIKGLQINAVARETNATPFNLNLVCKSNSTQSDGSNIAIGGQTYSTKTRILETDPDTAAAWTNSGLVSAKFGVKVP